MDYSTLWVWGNWFFWIASNRGGWALGIVGYIVVSCHGHGMPRNGLV